MGPVPPRSIAFRTWRDRRIASSTPTAIRSAMPITTARPPPLNGPDPNSTPLSFLTSWPCGINEARMSSSVIAWFPISIGKIDKVRGRHDRNGFRVEDVFGPPDIHGVGTVTEALEPFLQASLLGFQNVQAEARYGPDQMQRDVTEALYRVVDESLGAAEQAPVFATHRAPHQRAIPGVELLHSAIGLDDLGTGDTDAALFGHGKRRATAGNQSATTEHAFNRRRGLRPFILNLCSVAFLTSPRDVVAQADTKGVIYERASYCFCRRVGF